HGSDDDHAENNVLHRIANFELCATAGDGLHEERARECAENCAAAAVETGASDYDGGDDFQLESDAGGWIADIQLGELIDAGETDEESTQCVNADLER